MKNNIFTFSLLFSWASFAFQSVDINKASAEQIALLPGVGEKLAKNLVSYRQKNGSYAEEKDLLQVPGMKEATLKKISALIIYKSTHPRKVAPVSNQTNTITKRPMIELSVLEKQALNTLGLDDGWKTHMLKRTRHSSMLPKLSLAFDYEHDVDLRQKNIFDTPNTSLKQSGNGIGVGLRAAFDLSELIFHKSEIEIANLALKRLEKREKIIQNLHTLYFAYRKLQESGLKPKDSEEINKIKSELEHISAALDSLSNNAFSRYQEGAQL